MLVNRCDGAVMVMMTERCHMFARTTAGDIKTGGTALMTVKLRGANADDDAVM